MRVLIVNTSEREGGAAVAANRLMDALNNNGVKAKMLVRDKETDNITVVGLKGGLLQRFRFLWNVGACIIICISSVTIFLILTWPTQALTSRSCLSLRRLT